MLTSRPRSADVEGQLITLGIQAAATTLRDSSGRDRKTALRKMANAWGATVTEKVGGKYKHRLGSALAEDIQASVCKAALDWEVGSVQHAVVEEPSQSSDARSSSRVNEGTVVKKAKTIGAAEHGAALATHAGGTVHQLPETPNDVISLSRLGPDMFESTL